MKDELLALAERRIFAAAHKLAAQTGGVFVVNPRKLADYRRRAKAKDHSGGGE